MTLSQDTQALSKLFFLTCSSIRVRHDFLCISVFDMAHTINYNVKPLFLRNSYAYSLLTFQILERNANSTPNLRPETPKKVTHHHDEDDSEEESDKSA